MRRTIEIEKDLNAAIVAFEAAPQDESRSALLASVKTFTAELQEAQISEAAAAALANQRVLSPSERREVKRFSIAKMLRQASSGRLDGFEAEMNEEARKEFEASGVSMQGVGVPSFVLRDYAYNNASESGKGAEFKAITQWSYQEALRNALVCQRLGVNYLTGLQGNIRMTKSGGATAAWLSEEAAATTQKINYSNVDMSPHRLQVLTGYTYDLLKQSSLDVENLIWQDMTNAHASALDAAILCGTGASGQPTGIASTVGVNALAVAGAMTFAKLVDMETKVSTANGLAGRLAYVTNSAIAGSLKTTPQVAGYPLYLMQSGMANGYDVAVTNAVDSGKALFGNFADVVTGQWGGLDFLVDPYTAKGKAVIEVSAIAYHDVL